MENTRTKIASLTEKELAQLLAANFFKLGKTVKLSSVETKILLESVYRKFGGMYVDDFNEAFSEYAAGDIPDADKLHPNVSPMFICRLLKFYTKRKNENKLYKREGSAIGMLTPESKCNRFIHFVITNKSLPANPDWVCIYEHLAELKRMAYPDNWEAITYTAKRRFAANKVSEWACKNFNIKNSEENELVNYK